MAADDYQANWRGARQYQFDEEVRRKRATSQVVKFRTVKHADPEEKLKVLVEDIAPPAPPASARPSFPLVVAAVVCVTFAAVLAI